MLDEFDIKSCAYLFFGVGESIFFVGRDIANCCPFIEELNIAFLRSDAEEVCWVVFHLDIPAAWIEINTIVGALVLFVKSKFVDMLYIGLTHAALL